MTDRALHHMAEAAGDAAAVTVGPGNMESLEWYQAVRADWFHNKEQSPLSSSPPRRQRARTVVSESAAVVPPLLLLLPATTTEAQTQRASFVPLPAAIGSSSDGSGTVLLKAVAATTLDCTKSSRHGTVAAAAVATSNGPPENVAVRTVESVESVDGPTAATRSCTTTCLLVPPPRGCDAGPTEFVVDSGTSCDHERSLDGDRGMGTTIGVDTSVVGGINSATEIDSKANGEAHNIDVDANEAAENIRAATQNLAIDPSSTAAREGLAAESSVLPLLAGTKVPLDGVDCTPLAICSPWSGWSMPPDQNEAELSGDINTDEALLLVNEVDDTVGGGMDRSCRIETTAPSISRETDLDNTSVIPATVAASFVREPTATDATAHGGGGDDDDTIHDFSDAVGPERGDGSAESSTVIPGAPHTCKEKAPPDVHGSKSNATPVVEIEHHSAEGAGCELNARSTATQPLSNANSCVSATTTAATSPSKFPIQEIENAEVGGVTSVHSSPGLDSLHRELDIKLSPGVKPPERVYVTENRVAALNTDTPPSSISPSRRRATVVFCAQSLEGDDDVTIGTNDGSSDALNQSVATGDTTVCEQIELLYRAFEETQAQLHTARRNLEQQLERLQRRQSGRSGIVVPSYSRTLLPPPEPVRRGDEASARTAIARADRTKTTPRALIADDTSAETSETTPSLSSASPAFSPPRDSANNARSHEAAVIATTHRACPIGLGLVAVVNASFHSSDTVAVEVALAESSPEVDSTLISQRRPLESGGNVQGIPSSPVCNYRAEQSVRMGSKDSCITAASLNAPTDRVQAETVLLQGNATDKPSQVLQDCDEESRGVKPLVEQFEAWSNCRGAPAEQNTS